jgi:uncharacterized surface protein with fasciclin (FAS1) repeats
MKNFRSIIFLAFVSSIIVCNSCKDSLEKKIYYTTDKLTLAERLELSPDTFSSYIEILQKTGFINALKSYGNYTCFVPSNEAVLKYLNKQWNINTVSQLTTPEQIKALQLIVKFHTMPTRKLTTSFNEGRMADTTFTGDFLTTTFAAGGGLQNVLINKTAKIIAPDLNMDNGVIHVINTVMDPFIDPVPIVMDKTGKYKIFVEAMRQTGYFETFSKIYNETNSRKYFTIIAESDSVFKLSNINSFNDLANLFSPGSADYTNLFNPLNRFVAYHATTAFLYSSDFPADGFVSTVLTNNAIKALKSGNILKINETETGTNDTWLSLIIPDSNNPARNGVFHSVDKVMNIFIPRAKYILFDPVNDQPEVQSKAIAYNSYVYSTAFQFVRWYPESALRFLTYASSLNNSVFDLKACVWYEFDTPVIPKGKYQLLVCSSGGSTARGIFQVFWDGEPIGKVYDLTYGGNNPFGFPDSTIMEANGWRHGLKRIITNGVSQYDSKGLMRFIISTELLCPVQKKHVIRLETAKSGGIPLDYFEWIPIN